MAPDYLGPYFDVASERLYNRIRVYRPVIDFGKIRNMGANPTERNLSIAELEALIEKRRRPLVAERLQRIALAEDRLEQEARDDDESDGLTGLVSARMLQTGALALDAGSLEPISEEGARRGVADRILLGIELLLLLAFIIAAVRGWLRLQQLNAGMRAAQTTAAVPSPTATPSITSIDESELLFAAAEASPAPRESPTEAIEVSTEIPATPTTIPPMPAPGVPKRLVIDALDLDASIVIGDSWEDLEQGVGYRADSGLPGQVGNVVLSAHNDIYGELFRDLYELETGDDVCVYSENAGYRYRVESVEIVEPTRVEFVEPTDYPALTLITCHPYLVDTQRVVVRARLVDWDDEMPYERID